LLLQGRCTNYYRMCINVEVKIRPKHCPTHFWSEFIHNLQKKSSPKIRATSELPKVSNHTIGVNSLNLMTLFETQRTVWGLKKYLLENLTVSYPFLLVFVSYSTMIPTESSPACASTIVLFKSICKIITSAPAGCPSCPGPRRCRRRAE
jgi:hypothetical protein